ncbi:hypothetical protein DSO57_1015327 [Entomophthora muscae]|uniref:Uncharacterized protein n=1 Tax=Entomophthora muscae TaxID=34485 RepID=A0ACC2UEJ8_9FUNG|nr:hypothetical protein DSO57_1015327 [Entomophthora muscae]
MEIPPLIDAQRLGEIINAIASLKFLPKVLKLLILTSVTSVFDAYNTLFFNRESFEQQAERYVQLELAKNRQEKRVAIITGANTGIGYLTAKNLLKAGYRVIIGCRSPIKAELAIQKLKAESKEGVDIESIKLDLADFSSVRNFAEEFKKKNLPLHLLISNVPCLSHLKSIYLSTR